MSLPVAERGEKDHLRPLWEAEREPDLERACRDEGRNDAVWAWLYWRLREGHAKPVERDVRLIVSRANRATGCRNVAGELERYTRHECRETIEQVWSYRRAAGLGAMVRRGDGKTERERAVLKIMREIALMSGGYEFAAAHRRVAAAAGVPLATLGGILGRLRSRRLIWRVGETRPRAGMARGTSIWSLRPPRPRQRLDEARPPVYDAKTNRWTWAEPKDRGVLTSWRYLQWCKAHAEEATQERIEAMSLSVPNVQNTPLLTYTPTSIWSVKNVFGLDGDP